MDLERAPDDHEIRTELTLLKELWGGVLGGPSGGVRRVKGTLVSTSAAYGVYAKRCIFG